MVPLLAGTVLLQVLVGMTRGMGRQLLLRLVVLIFPPSLYPYSSLPALPSSSHQLPRLP